MWTNCGQQTLPHSLQSMYSIYKRNGPHVSGTCQWKQKVCVSNKIVIHISNYDQNCEVLLAPMEASVRPDSDMISALGGVRLHGGVKESQLTGAVKCERLCCAIRTKFYVPFFLSVLVILYTTVCKM